MGELTKVSEEALPNYYTDAQKNASWLSAENIFSANFLFDKVVKNLGFMIGAAYSGGVYTKAIGGVARLAGGLKAARAAKAAGMSLESVERARSLGAAAAESTRATKTTKGIVGAFFNA